jgi:hypothetical protein
MEGRASLGDRLELKTADWDWLYFYQRISGLGSVVAPKIMHGKSRSRHDVQETVGVAILSRSADFEDLNSLQVILSSRTHGWHFNIQ